MAWLEVSSQGKHLFAPPAEKAVHLPEREDAGRHGLQLPREVTPQVATGGSDVRGCQVPCYHLPLPQPGPRVLKAFLSSQIKYSHLGLPWRAKDLFRTEQKDEFTPKSRGPAEIQKASSQVSCIPLGTLREYCPWRKVLFAP